MRAPLILFALAAAAVTEAQPPKPALDYEYFRDRVQPIFWKKRPGHARCVVCHEHGSPPLPAMKPGVTSWTEEESRRNYEIWKQFVVPGEPMKSSLLRHPLSASAGGDRFHAGGKHWKSQSDPDWQTIAAWVKGQKK